MTTLAKKSIYNIIFGSLVFMAFLSWCYGNPNILSLTSLGAIIACITSLIIKYRLLFFRGNLIFDIKSSFKLPGLAKFNFEINRDMPTTIVVHLLNSHYKDVYGILRLLHNGKVIQEKRIQKHFGYKISNFNGKIKRIPRRGKHFRTTAVNFLDVPKGFHGRSTLEVDLDWNFKGEGGTDDRELHVEILVRN